MRYKGIIFDFNGVLLWDSHLHEQAWMEFSQKLRGKAFTIEEIYHHVHGKTNRRVLEYLLQRDLSDQEIKDYSYQKEAVYQRLCLENVDDFKLSPGAQNLFEFLMENNIPHTIATASDRGNLDFFIEHLHLDRWFDLTKIVYDDGSYPGKQEMFEKAAKNLLLYPKECIVIEDSKSGIAAAFQAKIGKIIGLGPKQAHEVLLSLEGINEVIVSLEQFDRGIFENCFELN